MDRIAAVTVSASAQLQAHPNRQKWNTRHAAAAADGRELNDAAWVCQLPELTRMKGTALELACGRSAAVIELAVRGWHVSAVDISDAALNELAGAAAQHGVRDRVDLVQANLDGWTADNIQYDLVACRMFWGHDLFAEACSALAPGGLLVWEALADTQDPPPPVSRAFCLRPGEPASLLPASLVPLREAESIAGPSSVHEAAHLRRLVARRIEAPGSYR